MGRIEGQIKKQQRDRMFQEKIEQTLDETDLFEQEKKEIMDELVNERKEEPEEHVDSHYEVKQGPVPSSDDDIDNRQCGINISPVTYTHGTISSEDTIVDNPGVGESILNSGMQYYKSDADTGNNSINPTCYQTLNPELIPDVSFAAYVKARQEKIMQEAMVLQPRHTRYNDANTIFVYGCSDCPFMRKKAFENKILITCHFNPEQEFILEQGHSADELDNLMRNNCKLRKLIKIKIHFI